MKIPASSRQRGFTLVELLVVISIIAVLAAAGFAAGNAAVQKARKTTALATCTAMESAVNQFFTEYGTMPKENMTEDTVPPIVSTDPLLLEVLLGIDKPTVTALNPRLVKFLSVREGKANKNGLMYNTNGTSVTGLYDPWGGPFKIMLDGDYDEKIAPVISGITYNLNGRRVVVWSEGADYKTTKKSGDDVKTW